LEILKKRKKPWDTKEPMVNGDGWDSMRRYYKLRDRIFFVLIDCSCQNDLKKSPRALARRLFLIFVKKEEKLKKLPVIISEKERA
jgi:hypothetical protein